MDNQVRVTVTVVPHPILDGPVLANTNEKIRIEDVSMLNTTWIIETITIRYSTTGINRKKLSS